MKQAGRLLLLVCALLSAAPAAARPLPPNKVEKVEMAQLDRVYLRFSGTSRALRKLTNCLLARNPAAGRAVFDHPTGSRGQAEALDVFYGPDRETTCLNTITSKLRTSNVMAIGSLADELIDVEGVAPIRKLNASLPDGGGDFVWTWNRLDRQDEFPHVILAGCLVDKHPAKVAEVLATEETSDKERKVLNAMTSEIKDCIAPGQKMTMHPMVLRAGLATAYYAASRSGGAGA